MLASPCFRFVLSKSGLEILSSQNLVHNLVVWLQVQQCSGIWKFLWFFYISSHLLLEVRIGAVQFFSVLDIENLANLGSALQFSSFQVFIPEDKCGQRLNPFDQIQSHHSLVGTRERIEDKIQSVVVERVNRGQIK